MMVAQQYRIDSIGVYPKCFFHNLVCARGGKVHFDDLPLRPCAGEYS